MPPPSTPTPEDTTSIPPINIDPHIVPWSYRGSYMCLATRSGDGGKLSAANNDICLVTHIYPWGCPLFALRPNLPGIKRGPPSGFHQDPSPFQFQATPSCLQWLLKGKVVAEATFQDERIVRMKGSLPMSFDTEGKLGKLGVDHWRTWMYRVPGPTNPNGAEEVEFTSTPDTSLKFIALKGKFEVEIEDKSIDVYLPNNRRLTISATGGNEKWDDIWELAIIEREREPNVVLPKLDFPYIGTVKEKMGKGFEDYVRDLCPWQKDWGSKQGQTDQLACYVMWTSTVRPAGYFKKEAVLMSKLWMNKVWSWDNCFNCLALAQAYPGIAIDQMMIPFDYITPEGRLPDSITHSEILYDYTKPPIYGWTAFKLLGFLAHDKQTNIFEAVSNTRLTELYDKIAKNTMFWYNCRKAKGLRVPWYTHGNDSGWDNATCYDRQTIAASPDLAAFLIVQNDFLAEAAHHLGDTEAEKEWESRRDDMIEALLELWDDENKVFQFQDAYDFTKWSTPTLLKYIPLVASAHLPHNIIESMTTGLRAHLTEWGLATEDPKSPDYDPDGYWRGPIWAPPTILIESGLRVAGNVEFANEISERYQRLCEKSGLAENYNAITGEGNRDLSYTWSASTYLVLRREQEEREARNE